jgi:putative FmdB family regulatory protein
MPTYEFRCRSCGTTFTEQRPMIASNDPATCPDGHSDTTRLLSMAGALTGASSAPAPPVASSGGGCCGGGCCS